MRIVQHSRIDFVTKYALSWTANEDGTGGGYSFDCDEDGAVSEDINERPAALANLERCRAGLTNLHFQGIREYEVRVRTPRIGLCECGRRVTLTAFTNPCVCGTDYNMSGQTLAAREFWGEETGEHWTECI
jgi:hypothetical protein